MIITGKKFSKPAMSRVINGDVVLDNNDEKPEKFRLDHLLVKQHPEFNRSSLQSFIKSGYVTVDGAVAKKANTLIEESQKIELNLPPELADDSVKTAKINAARPETIYEDKNVLVVNKPAGLLSMAKGEYCAEPTLEDYGLLVHRLDRDTSGVVILAKNEPTQKMLRKQFQDRKAHKTYYAIVEGKPKHEEANIDLPILRSLKRPNTFIIDPSGKPSQTYYKTLGTIRILDPEVHELHLHTTFLSLVMLKPTTGRTHQLRVHLNYLGTPILGDRVYGSNDNPTTRLMLHAASLEVSIPNPNVEFTGESSESAPNERMVFTTPLPREFISLLGDLVHII